MIAIVHSIYSQSVNAPALNAGLMDNDAERYCICHINNMFRTRSLSLMYGVNLAETSHTHQSTVNACLNNLII